MLKKFTSFLQKIPLFVFVLAAVELILFLTNYKPGTYLIGWDSLHPELNYLENLKRQVFAVWQEYRGLGLLDGMANGANLPHTLLAYIVDSVLPKNFVRYSVIFLLHFLGGVGAYTLIKRLLRSTGNSIAALTGALFYLFNLATIQMFYTPFEVFAYHFAFLPWLLYFLVSYLFDKKRSSLIYFGIFSFVSLPQAFVPQVFLAYLVPVSLICLTFLLGKSGNKLRRIIPALLLLIGINSIWALPYTYSVTKNAGTIISSKINEMSSGDTYLRNQARGDFKNVFSLKGSMLDIVEFDKSANSEFIMQPWREHLNTPLFKTISILLTFASLFGLILSIFKKDLLMLPFVGSLVVALFFLASNSPGLNFLNNFLRENIPVFGEAFRFSFTKFSTLFALSLGIFLSYFLNLLTQAKFFKKFSGRALLTSAALLVFLLYSLPSFQGNFFYKNIKVDVPQEYLETINFFKGEDSTGRIATFPQPTFWSWRYHNNGYRGSGFLWMGVPQPMLDRAFDPWSSKNEGYYWEVSYALYSKNPDLFLKVLEKYGVKWVLIDKNVVNYTSPKGLYFDELHKVLSTIPSISLSKSLGGIEIYEVKSGELKNRITIAENLPKAGPAYGLSNLDMAFKNTGDYVTGDETPSVYYLFRSLLTSKKQTDLDFKIRTEGERIIISREIGDKFDDYYLALPELGYDELTSTDPNNLGKTSNLTPLVSYKDGVVEVIVPKPTNYYSAEIDPEKDTGVQKTFNCYKNYSDKAEYVVVRENDRSYIDFLAADGNSCNVSYWLPSLSYRWGYLVSFEAKHKLGKNLLFWLENVNTRKPDIETYLGEDKDFKPYFFIQPPMELDGYGYSLHFDNLSIGSQVTANQLGNVSVYPIPYRFLTELSFRLPGKATDAIPTKTLVYSQAYNDEWIAFSNGKRLNSHVLVNNWANGWEIDQDAENKKITLIFLPQLLQFLGFVMGILALCYSAYVVRGKSNL